jgi:hypothetical protein
LLSITLNFGSTAQFVQAVQGAGYADAVYLDLATRSTTTVPHTAWDIAFTVGSRTSGILINEGIASSQDPPSSAVEVYLSTSPDFASADTSQRGDRLHNGQCSWQDGAFNTPATPGNALDLGWGTYNPATQAVAGSRTFLVKTREGEFHKFRVESLVGSIYTIIHANTKGGATDTVRIDKTDYTGKTLAYFSFANGAQDLEPANWDLLFTRYVTPLEAEPGDTLDYTVTGVLQNQGVTVAKLTGVDPTTVPAPTGDDAYSDTLTTIGHEWKSIDLTTFAWTIPEDLVYFVRTPDSTYRLQFIDFEGSSTGTSTFSVAGVESTTALALLPVQVTASRLYPNPTASVSLLTLESKQATEEAWLHIADLNGRSLLRTRVPALSVGSNQVEVPVHGLPAGHYLVRLESPLGTLTHHLVKQ